MHRGFYKNLFLVILSRGTASAINFCGKGMFLCATSILVEHPTYKKTHNSIASYSYIRSNNNNNDDDNFNNIYVFDIVANDEIIVENNNANNNNNVQIYRDVHRKNNNNNTTIIIKATIPLPTKLTSLLSRANHRYQKLGNNMG
jgi:hypothetical protein